MVWACGRDSWIIKCREFKVEGEGKTGPKELGKGHKDFRVRGVSFSWSEDRDRWRAASKEDRFVNKDPCFQFFE